jgi:hypothetical protein
MAAVHMQRPLENVLMLRQIDTPSVIAVAGDLDPAAPHQCLDRPGASRQMVGELSRLALNLRERSAHRRREFRNRTHAAIRSFIAVIKCTA